MTSPLSETDRALLMDEGDLLSRRLAQQLYAPLERQDRITLYGRSLALNLVQALLPTIEQITWRMDKPLSAHLTSDLRGRAVVQTVTFDGELHRNLPVDDLIETALFVRGRLHPKISEKLLGALHGSEHAATRALVACLKSKPVLDATQRYLRGLLGQGRLGQ
ncbi:hypothetical protein EHF33_12200 [Deinococcus psychrotolerans]|uniref:Uncharacterized protein n=1 Tax=Deinococcus psychrotolerans TaxID=2489213 RepID=A0A3G8YEM4_9DEIO|nr:hypothetical protein [Deinococcus psychrotolerans]AZI43413.1 hypothetical protein EHF33_12200 [Deinococcus psychrotolerans]